MNSRKFKLGVLVSGRGTNLQAIIDSVERGTITGEIAVIISDNADAFALERGRKHGIESVFLDPKKYPDKELYDQALIDLLKSRQVDLVCLAGFMRILGKEFIRAFRGKIMNIHPSLLPAFPGLNVQQKAIDQGVKFSGCTVHFVDEEVDAGPIISQAIVPVHETDDAEKLSQRILEQEHLIFPEAIQSFIENRLIISGRKVRLRKN